MGQRPARHEYTGVILLTTGTGPIRGFATTWIIGIVVSFFTAVFLTRLVYDYKLNHDKWMHCKFDTPVSHNLMQGKKYKFMSMYKTTFTDDVVAVKFSGACPGFPNFKTSPTKFFHVLHAELSVYLKQKAL